VSSHFNIFSLRLHDGNNPRVARIRISFRKLDNMIIVPTGLSLPPPIGQMRLMVDDLQIGVSGTHDPSSQVVKTVTHVRHGRPRPRHLIKIRRCGLIATAFVKSSVIRHKDGVLGGSKDASAS